jgi:hypothetical protein
VDRKTSPDPGLIAANDAEIASYGRLAALTMEENISTISFGQTIRLTGEHLDKTGHYSPGD